MKPIMWIVRCIVVEILLYRFVQHYRSYTVFEDCAKQRAKHIWNGYWSTPLQWKESYVVTYSTTC